MEILPDELVLQLMSFLNLGDLGVCARVCVRLRGLVGEVRVLGRGSKRNNDLREEQAPFEKRAIWDETLGQLPGVREVHLRVYLSGVRGLGHLDEKFSGPLRAHVPVLDFSCIQLMTRRFLRDPAQITSIRGGCGSVIGWKNGALTFVVPPIRRDILTSSVDISLALFCSRIRKLAISHEDLGGFCDLGDSSHTLPFGCFFSHRLDFGKLEELTLDSSKPLFLCQGGRVPEYQSLRVVRYKDFHGRGVSVSLYCKLVLSMPSCCPNITHVPGLIAAIGQVPYLLTELPRLQELGVYTSSIIWCQIGLNPEETTMHLPPFSLVPRSQEVSVRTLNHLRLQYPNVTFREYRKIPKNQRLGTQGIHKIQS